ncbi:T9SS type A sorting domain-containing protein [Flavobacterium pallidum]|nr:T9SS type A sorting domain-containing protein [Flavobacterium pallidum]
MKKNYAFLISFFVLLWSFSVSAQIVANDDVVDNLNSYYPGGSHFYVHTNDTFNGSEASLSNVAITQLSSTSSAVYIMPGTGRVNVYNAPVGTYTLTYRICEIGNPNNCDSATVTISVCNQPTPSLTVNPINNCSDTVGVTLGNLPAGPWSIKQRRNGTPDVVYTGSGSSTVISNLSGGLYYFSVTNASGCTSAEKSSDYIGSYNGTIFTYNYTGTYQDTNNDGIINIGDAVFYQLSITNVTACDMTASVYDEDQDTIFTGPTFVTIPAGVTNNEITGYLLLTQADINSGHTFNWWALSGWTQGGASDYSKAFTNTALNIGDGFRLNAFLDDNNNGIQDSGELNYDYGIFNVEMNNNGVVHHLYPDFGFHTVYESNPSNVYSASFTANPSNNCEYVSANSYPNINVATGSGIITYNFPVTYAPCTDVSIHVSPSIPRPGLVYHNGIYYHNRGTMPVASGTINFYADPVLTVSSVSTPGAVITPTGFTYDFINLMPGETRFMAVYMLVPPIPTVSLGDQLTSTANIAIPETEITMANNTHSAVRTIVGSYDPNDKSESHGGKIVHAGFTADDYLTYTIRFENTGTANAFKIRVADMLDEKLDETSVSMIASSHHYILDRVDNNLEWRFDGINLPPSVENTDTGKGYIIFQVKPKPGYAIGDIIPNAAEIYFDFNPAIVTNTFETEFTAPLSVDDIEGNMLSLYPNPVKDELTINGTKTIQEVGIYNLLGQKVLGQKIDAVSGSMDVSGLETGVYLVRVISAEAEKTIRIIKQ